MTHPFYPRFEVVEYNGARVPHPAVTLVLESGPLTLEPQQVAALIEAARLHIQAYIDCHDGRISGAELYRTRTALAAALAAIPTAGSPGGLVRPQPAGQEAVSPEGGAQ